MNLKLLKLLAQNARYEIGDLAVMTGLTEQEVASEMAAMEKEGLICGYKTVIDWERSDTALVSALIELKVTPQSDLGFEGLAARLARYDEVESVYLMSGAFDFCVMVKGRTFQEVAMFVAKRLAPLAGVISTATHFVLRRYKELDVILCDGSEDDRGSLSL